MDWKFRAPDFTLHGWFNGFGNFGPLILRYMGGLMDWTIRAPDFTLHGWFNGLDILGS